MPVDASTPTVPISVITATWLETWITKLILRRTARVRQVGVGATGTLDDLSGPIIVCGLAGALSPALRPRAVVIPSWIGTELDERFECDPEFRARLTAAAHVLGHRTILGPVVAASHLVTGSERERWAGQGFVAVEMESGELLSRGHRLAVVRVILDTPARDLSAIWEHPWAALRRPGVWLEALRLAVDAPRATLRAARIVKYALADER